MTPACAGTLPQPPVFAEPWHAQLFALTVHLNEAGRFGWPEWAECFSDMLKRHGLAKELDGGDDYFNAWLDALEALLTEKGMAEAVALRQIKADWEAAYLSTPHGEPVRLAD